MIYSISQSSSFFYKKKKKTLPFSIFQITKLWISLHVVFFFSRASYYVYERCWSSCFKFSIFSIVWTYFFMHMKTITSMKIQKFYYHLSYLKQTFHLCKDKVSYLLLLTSRNKRETMLTWLSPTHWEEDTVELPEITSNSMKFCIWPIIYDPLPLFLK